MPAARSIPSARRREPPLAGAFTLIELLVVIAIIALLIGIVLPALGGARESARQLTDLARAQQLMLAFHLYADDNAGAVLPGYPPADWLQGANRPRNTRGEPIEINSVAQRYPWRLVPYFEGNLLGLYERVPSPDVQHQSAGTFDYLVSLFPSFGMNTYFVGGREGDAGGFDPAYRRYFGEFYIRRDDQPRRPDQLITFATARRFVSTTEVSLFHLDSQDVPGYFEVKPPKFLESNGWRWDQVYEPVAAHEGDYGMNSGNVALRYKGRATTAMFDGHAQTMDWDQLNDMRHWSDRADAPDWGLAPIGAP